MKKEFRFIIEDIRENELHMTQREFADALGVKYTTVESWETGTFPKADKLLAIAKYCNCSVDYLLGLSPAKSVDKDLQSVCEYTGLSEKAIQELKKKDAFATFVSFLIEDSISQDRTKNGTGSEPEHSSLLMCIINYLISDGNENELFSNMNAIPITKRRMLDYINLMNIEDACRKFKVLFEKSECKSIMIQSYDEPFIGDKLIDTVTAMRNSVRRAQRGEIKMAGDTNEETEE